MKNTKMLLLRKAKAKFARLKREIGWWPEYRKNQIKYGCPESVSVSRLWERLKRLLKQEEFVLTNIVEEVEHPCRTHSLVKKYVSLSKERMAKKGMGWKTPFKQGDLVASQLPYWGWGGTKKGVWGGDEVVTSGPETFGRVYQASPDYMYIEWRSKDGDIIDRRDNAWGEGGKDGETAKIGSRNYDKCYNSIKRERRAQKDVYVYDETGWREKEGIVYDYSAIGPDGEKIFFRKIEVPKEVRDWAQRSKISARFF